MIEIDGSLGEGGGQVLRSALTLSIMTGQATRITNIRARRKKPGLQAQHLAAVHAAAAISDAEVEGACLDASELRFQPGAVRPGAYRFDIGTAGATSLVLQTIFLPLALHTDLRGFGNREGLSSEITLTGGTHVPWSPCFHYLTMQWLPALRRIGLDGELTLVAAGFYPQGGGQIVARIEPAPLTPQTWGEEDTPKVGGRGAQDSSRIGGAEAQNSPRIGGRGAIAALDLPERGALRGIRGISVVANLPISIAERQRDQAVRRLAGQHRRVEIDVETLPATFKGTVLLLLAEFRHGSACYFGLGALGKPAERVADEAVDRLEAFLAGSGAIDQYLADQLLLPLAFASGESRFRTAQVTQHLLTNAEVIRAFGVAEIEIAQERGKEGVVRVIPRI